MTPSTSSLTAIVTGAGSGIGNETTIQLAKEGCRLVLVGRTEAKLHATAARVKQEYKADDVECHVLAGNLGDPITASEAVDLAVRAFGRLDAVAHIAGDAPNLPIDQVTPTIYRRCLDANLSAAVYLAAAALPVMRRQRTGVFVNVSSMASVDPLPGFAIYAAAKAGLNMFTRCIATEEADHGIQAVSVAPGAVETPMLRALFDETMIPRDRTLAPGDVAAVICECLTGRRPFDSGEVILMPNRN